MNLQQLEYILALEEHRHFVKAAEACFVTQSTLSMMVKKLEEELGAPIFDRKQKPLAPTPLGQKVLRKARLVLQQAGQLKAMVDWEQNQLGGRFRLGIIPTFSALFIAFVFAQFSGRLSRFAARFERNANPRDGTGHACRRFGHWHFGFAFWPSYFGPRKPLL